jgi:hypothetical protein
MEFPLPLIGPQTLGKGSGGISSLFLGGSFGGQPFDRPWRAKFHALWIAAAKIAFQNSTPRIQANAAGWAYQKAEFTTDAGFLTVKNAICAVVFIKSPRRAIFGADRHLTMLADNRYIEPFFFPLDDFDPGSAQIQFPIMLHRADDLASPAPRAFFRVYLPALFHFG